MQNSISEQEWATKFFQIVKDFYLGRMAHRKAREFKDMSYVGVRVEINNEQRRFDVVCFHTDNGDEKTWVMGKDYEYGYLTYDNIFKRLNNPSHGHRSDLHWYYTPYMELGEEGNKYDEKIYARLDRLEGVGKTLAKDLTRCVNQRVDLLKLDWGDSGKTLAVHPYYDPKTRTFGWMHQEDIKESIDESVEGSEKIVGESKLNNIIGNCFINYSERDILLIERAMVTHMDSMLKWHPISWASPERFKELVNECIKAATNEIKDSFDADVKVLKETKSYGQVRLVMADDLTINLEYRKSENHKTEYRIFSGRTAIAVRARITAPDIWARAMLPIIEVVKNKYNKWAMVEEVVNVE